MYSTAQNARQVASQTCIARDVAVKVVRLNNTRRELYELQPYSLVSI